MKMITWLLLILLTILCVVLVIRYSTLKLRVAFADEQVVVFQSAVLSADKITDPRELSGQMEYIVNYYPSGSKQKTGSQLDRIVEAARSNAIETIIRRLRDITGKDLGEEPAKWFAEYPPK